jgi:hypothetical protein
MLLRFNSKEDRDTVANLSPVIYDGAHVSLERSEETTNRFEVKLDWLVALAVVGSQMSTGMRRGSRRRFTRWAWWWRST